MGTPVHTPHSDYCALYVQVQPTENYWRGPASEEPDVCVELFMSIAGEHGVDLQSITQITKQVEHWGLSVVGSIERIPWENGPEVCLQYTLNLRSKERAPEKIKEARDNLDESLLRKIVRAKFQVAGTAAIEEFFLNDERIAAEVTLITNGDLRIEENKPRLIEDGDERFFIKAAAVGQYNFMVPKAQEGEDYAYTPQHTAKWVAGDLGVFLNGPIADPTRSALQRSGEPLDDVDDEESQG